MPIRILSSVLLCTLLTLTVRAADLTAATAEKAAPEGVAAEITEVLQGKAVQLKDDDTPVIEIWLRNEVPLKEQPEEPRRALRSISQGTLIGVMAVHEDRRDYRDDELAKGVYTMRFVLQPQDGDHLGTAIYPYFVALIPVEKDQTVKGISDYDAVTEASGEGTATEHPRVISLRPGEGSELSDPKITEPADDHKAVHLTVPAAPAEGEKTVLPFELVYEGIGHL